MNIIRVVEFLKIVTIKLLMGRISDEWSTRKELNIQNTRELEKIYVHFNLIAKSLSGLKFLIFLCVKCV